MAEKNEKAIEKDQATIIQDGAKKDELAQKDLEKAVGGTWTWTKGGAPQD
jgi:hypothetical protein